MTVKNKNILIIIICILLSINWIGCNKQDDISNSENENNSQSNSENSSESSDNLNSSEISESSSDTSDSSIESLSDIEISNSDESSKASDVSKLPTPLPTKEEDTMNKKVVSKLVMKDDYTYVEANGYPHLMYGVQIRIDDYFAGSVTIDKVEGMENYFKKASEIGFKTVIVSLPWNYIEFTKDEYEFDILLKPIIRYAEKYKLNVHINWFGSVFVGWPNMAPNYILNDSLKYPRIEGIQADPFDYNNLLLQERELAVVNEIMDCIAEYDVNNRIMMFTVAAEPDMRPVTGKMWGGQRKARIENNISPIGDAVHNSLRSMVTRVYSTMEETSLKDVFDTSGVDIVGIDPYNVVPNQFRQIVNKFAYPGNVPHAAENGGQYSNYTNLVLTAFNEGAGYLTYELRTTGSWRNYDFGIYKKTTPEMDEWIERDGTDTVAYYWDDVGPGTESKTSEIKEFNNTINKIHMKIAACPKNMSRAYNLFNNQISTETFTIGNLEITGNNSNFSMGFAFVDTSSNELILASFKGNTEFVMDYGLINNAKVSEGQYNDRNIWIESSSKNINSGKIVVKSGEVIKIPSSIWKYKN